MVIPLIVVYCTCMASVSGIPTIIMIQYVHQPPNECNKLMFGAIHFIYYYPVSYPLKSYNKLTSQ